MATATQSVREIVTAQPYAAAVFHRFDIDLCAQADLSLDQACRELQLSVEHVIEKLEDAKGSQAGATALDAGSISLTRLIQHIVRVHHQHVRQDLPRLAEMARKVAAKRGDRAPELQRIVELAEQLHQEMYAHIQDEEEVLFPFISQMDQQALTAYPAAYACFRSVAHPILMMEQEHESAERILAEIARLTNDFEIPSWACATHTALFAGLGQFQVDLRQHVHLENDVLFPRAMQMEADLAARN
jgi:regulator of cell morphogenesis and NO signaling